MLTHPLSCLSTMGNEEDRRKKEINFPSADQNWGTGRFGQSGSLNGCEESEGREAVGGGAQQEHLAHWYQPSGPVQRPERRTFHVDV